MGIPWAAWDRAVGPTWRWMPWWWGSLHFRLDFGDVFLGATLCAARESPVAFIPAQPCSVCAVLPFPSSPRVHLAWQERRPGSGSVNLCIIINIKRYVQLGQGRPGVDLFPSAAFIHSSPARISTPLLPCDPPRLFGEMLPKNSLPVFPVLSRAALKACLERLCSSLMFP